MGRADGAEFRARAGDFLDVEAFARFMATTVCLSTLDGILSIGQNYVVYLHPTSNKFQFVPWDLDHSFGQFFMMGNQDARENLDIHKPWQGENRFLERVFALETFKKSSLASLGKLSAGLFQPDRIGRQVDELAAALRPAVAAESAEKLERFNLVVAGEPVAPAGFGPAPGGGKGRGGSRFMLRFVGIWEWDRNLKSHAKAWTPERVVDPSQATGRMETCDRTRRHLGQAGVWCSVFSRFLGMIPEEESRVIRGRPVRAESLNGQARGIFAFAPLRRAAA